MAQATLSNQTAGNVLSIYWSWGIGVMLGVYVAGGISGIYILNHVIQLQNDDQLPKHS